ncbi:MAG TPA: cytochrome c3 family protein [Anaeromyxobacteraceae bacterium]|nr:cytochrome c3 family protein [Anaeromyxobacteraceae bacterium]
MSSLFKPRSNTAFRVVLVLLVGGGLASLGGFMVFARVPAGTGQQEPLLQPVLFDHRHHVEDDGIDCRYCHTSVERGASAGIPPTALCMNCHSQVWNKSPRLEPVRQSYFSGQPIPWVRVHRLPDFVYFDHSIHVNKGVGCETCHGRVDQMASIEQVAPLLMSWCLECHRNPAPNLRPLDQVTTMGWKAVSDSGPQGEELMKAYDVHTRTSCTTCHR